MAEIVEEVLGSVPNTFSFHAMQADSIPEGVLMEAARQAYDLIIMGASEEWISDTRLFGSVSDWIADRAPCSVLLCRRYEPVGIACCGDRSRRSAASTRASGKFRLTFASYSLE